MSSLSTFLNRNHFSKVFSPKLFALFSAYELLPEPLLCLALTPSSFSTIPDNSATPSGSDFHSPSSTFSINSPHSCQYPPPIPNWSPHTPPNHHPHLPSSTKLDASSTSTIPPSSLLICANSSAHSLLLEFVPTFSNDYPIPFSQFMTHCTSTFPTLPSSMHETVRCTLNFLFDNKDKSTKQALSLDWSARWVASTFLDDPSLEVSAYLFVTLKVVKKTSDFSPFPDPPASPPPTPTTLSSRRLSFSSFSYFNSNFHIEKLLGRGSYGAVYQCTHRLDGQRYAVKLVPIPFTHSVDNVLREVKTFASVSSHPNILRYFHAWMEQAPFEPFPNTSVRRRSMSHVTTPFLSTSSSSFNFPQLDTPRSEKKRTSKTFSSSDKETQEQEQHPSSAEKDPSFLPDEADDTDDDFDDEEDDEEEDYDEDNESFSDARSHLSLNDPKDGNHDPSHVSCAATPSTTFPVDDDNVMAEDPTFRHVWASTSSSSGTSSISPRPRHRRSRFVSCDSVMSLGYNPPAYPFCAPRPPTTPHNVAPVTSSLHGYPSPPLSFFSSSNSHVHLRRRTSEVSNYLFIQMECPEMTLKSFLKKRTQPLSLFTAISIWQQIALGLAHLHARGYVHCDLSSSNIFLNTLRSNHPDEAVQYQVLLGDFGLSVPIQDPSLPTASHPTTTCNFSSKWEDEIVPPIYMAPKTDRSSVSPSLDMYAMAILLVELVTFFSTGMERASVLMRFKQSLEIPPLPLTDPVLLDLFLRCGAHDPQKRPTAMDIYTACSLFLECAAPSLSKKKNIKGKKQVAKGLPLEAKEEKEKGSRSPRLEKKSKSFSFLRLKSSSLEEKIVFEKEAECSHLAEEGEMALKRRPLHAHHPFPRHFAFSLKDAEQFVKKVQMELNHELGLIRSSSSSTKVQKKIMRNSARMDPN